MMLYMSSGPQKLKSSHLCHRRLWVGWDSSASLLNSGTRIITGGLPESPLRNQDMVGSSWSQLRNHEHPVDRPGAVQGHTGMDQALLTLCQVWRKWETPPRGTGGWALHRPPAGLYEAQWVLGGNSGPGNVWAATMMPFLRHCFPLR